MSQNRFSGLNLQIIYILFLDTDVYKFLIWVSKLNVSKIVKAIQNRSNLVPSTQDISNLKITNLFVQTLVHRCPSTCFSAVGTFLWSEENIFYRTENISFSFFKNTRSQLAAFVIWKSRSVVFSTQALKCVFWGVLFATDQNLFRNVIACDI